MRKEEKEEGGRDWTTTLWTHWEILRIILFPMNAV